MTASSLPSSHLPPDHEARAWAELATTPLAWNMEDSRIRKVAGEVWEMERQGAEVCNLTIGDFKPHAFPVPGGFLRRLHEEIDAGQTNYTPSDGIPELRASVARLYREELGIDYGPDAVLVTAGARPAMYAAFRCFLEPGDGFAHGVPSWNTQYYVYLNQARPCRLVTDARSRFLPTADQVRAHVQDLRMLVLNSPLNPTGTAYRADELEAVCRVILEENRRRQQRSLRPLVLLYDQVNWTLTGPGTEHVHPLALVPELAPWTLYVDAISKSLAATGLRVGWAVVPPHLEPTLKSFVGHLGGFAPRPAQRATARYLEDVATRHRERDEMRGRIRARLDRLVDGVRSLREAGLPVDCIEPEGGIYLSIRFHLHGYRTPEGQRLETNEDIRRFLLHGARVAVVPFQAFGLGDETGWFRISVGAVDLDAIDGAFTRLAEALAPLTPPA